MVRPHFTTGRLLIVSVVFAGFFALFDATGLPRSEALVSATWCSVGPAGLVLATRTTRGLAAVFVFLAAFVGALVTPGVGGFLVTAMIDLTASLVPACLYLALLSVYGVLIHRAFVFLWPPTSQGRPSDPRPPTAKEDFP